MDPKQTATIAQAIALMQSLLSSAGSDQPIAVSIPAFDFGLGAALTKAKTLSPEIQALTNIYMGIAGLMKGIMGYSSICKKFTTEQQTALKNKFMAFSDETVAIEKKTTEYIDHCRAIRELLSTTFWVFVDSPEFIIKGAIESSEFNALKFQKKKIQEHNDWFKEINTAAKALEKYVVANYPTGLSFNFNGSNKWDELLTGKQGKLEDRTVQPAKAVVAAQKPVPVEPKKPKKELIGQNFFFTNYDNEKISFAEGELQMKHGVFIDSCKNLAIEINAKFKSIQLDKCSKVAVVFKNCVSGVEIMNSSEIQVYVKDTTPSVAVDKSQSVRLVLNESNLNCEIVSSKTAQLSISYEKSDGNEAKDFNVTEQLVTKWNAVKNAFETKLYDKFS